MRWLVCGGRDFDDGPRVHACLDHVARVLGLPEMLIVGDSRGADFWARHWASERKVRGIMCRADWTRNGRSGGPMRNARMLKYRPRLVIAFPGGSGTADMVAQAMRAEVEVIRVPA